MKARAISSPDAAYLLRVKLGPVRAWDDALADMRRNKTSYEGYLLLPCAYLREGRCERPYYRLSDVAEFIERVTAVQPSPPKASALRIVTIDVEPPEGMDADLDAIFLKKVIAAPAKWKMVTLKPAA